MAELGASTHALTSSLEQAVTGKFIEGGFSLSYPYAQASKPEMTIEILAYMDTLSKKQFDRETAKMIFEQCEPNELGDVKISDFAKQYSKGVAITRTNVSKTKSEIETKKKKLQTFRLKSDEVRQKDSMRPKGTLQVYLDKEVLLIWASKLSIPSVTIRQVYLTFTVDSKTKKTQVLNTSQLVDIDEFLDFEISGQSSPVTVFLYDSKDTGDRWQSSTDLNIHLDRFNKYSSKTLEADLLDKGNKATGSKL